MTLLFIQILASFFSYSMDFSIIKDRCLPASIDELTTSKQEWSRYKNSDEIIEDAKILYDSGRRLSDRVYWDGSSYVLPQSSDPIALTEDFIQAISRHISEALKNSYAEAVIYPDMGHVHILVPDQSVQRWNLNSELSKKDIKFLYHTGELIVFKKSFAKDEPLVNDSWLQWRYYSRNFVGDKENLGLAVLYNGNDLYNTVRAINGYQQVATLYFSASKKGCFPFVDKGEIKYFDIKL